MKKILFVLVSFLFIIPSVFAQQNQGGNNNITGPQPNRPILSSDNILGVSDADLRSGNVDLETIPRVLANIIEIIIGMAGAISVFMLIFFAVKMQLNSGITGNSSGVDSAKKGMIASGIGFLIAISAWFIMARIIDFLTITTGQ